MYGRLRLYQAGDAGRYPLEATGYTDWFMPTTGLCRFLNSGACYASSWSRIPNFFGKIKFVTCQYVLCKFFVQIDKKLIVKTGVHKKLGTRKGVQKKLWDFDYLVALEELSRCDV